MDIADVQGGDERLVAVPSDSPRYAELFEQYFLPNTNQKRTAATFLEAFCAGLPNRQVLVDVGAGEGILLQSLQQTFSRCIGVEPNSDLAAKLRVNCPWVDVQDTIITAATIAPGTAGCVISSHVFYYIPRDLWAENIQRMTTWLAPDGVVLLILQNPHTDCQQMIRHFFGEEQTYDMGGFATQLFADQPFEVEVETVRADIEITTDVNDLAAVAEFILNINDLNQPELQKRCPTRREMVAYLLARHWRDNRCRMSCDQDMVMIRRQA